jgi:transcriptional regulator with XRE-family HTH domain
VTVDLGSTVPRRQLGRYLRSLREEAQITLKAAATALEWSTQKIWRIENGTVPMRTHDVETMCRVYGAAAEATEALVGLARETKVRGWWHAYGDAIPSWFELYVGLEAAASRIRQYEAELVPGLVQTKGYVREVLRIRQPHWSEEERERRVAVRLERQRLLTRRLPPAPELDVIVNEAVLRRPIPDREAMAGQLRHLAEATELFNVTVRVLPFRVGLHEAAFSGAFSILEFPAGGRRDPEPPTVYSEGVTGALYLDKPVELATYEAIWAAIATVCLTPAESRTLIKTMAEGYERG